MFNQDAATLNILMQTVWDETQICLAEQAFAYLDCKIEDKYIDVELEERRSRKGKLPKGQQSTFLTEEQTETLFMWNMATKGHQALDLQGNRIEVDTPEFLKFVNKKGQKLVFHHWDDEGSKPSRRLRAAWGWADVIVCCHSATLPSQYRHKAALLKGGSVRGELFISPVYGKAEPAPTPEPAPKTEPTGSDFAAHWQFVAELQSVLKGDLQTHFY